MGSNPAAGAVGSNATGGHRCAAPRNRGAQRGRGAVAAQQHGISEQRAAEWRSGQRVGPIARRFIHRRHAPPRPPPCPPPPPTRRPSAPPSTHHHHHHHHHHTLRAARPALLAACTPLHARQCARVAKGVDFRSTGGSSAPPHPATPAAPPPPAPSPLRFVPTHLSSPTHPAPHGGGHAHCGPSGRRVWADGAVRGGAGGGGGA